MDRKCMNDYIMKRVEEHYKYLESIGLNVAAIFAQGSMNYGLYIQDDDYKSDVDTKAIVLPTLDDLIKGNKMISKKYDFEGEQIDVKDIRVMVDMWKKSNPAYLEILFTKYKVINPLYENFINQIINMGNDIVKMNFPQLAKCISGMSKEKVMAMEHLYPSLLDKIEKFNYDPKQLHHIIRLNRLIMDIFCCDVPFGEALEIDNERIKKYLINVKKGYLPLEKARENAIYYDNDTRKIKENVLDEYKDFEFNSKTYKKLMGIVHNCVKFNIIKQIKGDKKYLVFTQDEWNNLYYMGTYDDLKDAIPDVNNWLSVYDIQINELEEYPSTFGMCFDKEIETKDEQFLMVRGFILE